MNGKGEASPIDPDLILDLMGTASKTAALHLRKSGGGASIYKTSKISFRP